MSVVPRRAMGADVAPVAVPVSARTGEPRRPWSIAAADVALGLAALVGAVALLWAMWHMLGDLWGSARLIGWLKPAQSSLLATLSPVFCAALLLPVVFLAGAAAFYAWVGWRAARWLGVGAGAASLLTILATTASLVTIPLAVIGTVLLFLPASQRYLRAQEQRREVAATSVDRIEWPAHVHYGPLPRYREGA